MGQGDTVVRSLGALGALADEVGRLLGPEVERLAETVAVSLAAGGRLLFCGNGGSAADAQHLAAEYVVRFQTDRRPLPALALTTDTSVLTAAANDLGFEEIFARQVRALAREGDILFLHSTSGNSENLIRAAAAAGPLGVRTVALLARGGGQLATHVDQALVIPTDSTARAQEIHLALGHIVCELVEEKMVSSLRGESP